MNDSVIPRMNDSVISRRSDSVIPRMNDSVIPKDLPEYYDSFGGVYLNKHEGSVSIVTYTPDGSKFISGSQDGTIRIWDTLTGKQIGENMGKSFDIHKRNEYYDKEIDGDEGHKFIHTLSCSPDGKIIVAGGSNKLIYMWDANTRKLLRKPIIGHRASISHITFTPDGTKIVSSGGDFSDTTIRVWDVNTGKEIGDPIKDAHELWIKSLCYSPDGTRFVTGGADSTIRFWDAKTMEPLGEPIGEYTSGESSMVFNVQYSPDGSKILITGGTKYNAVYQWDANNGELLGVPFMGRDSVSTSVSYNPDGSSIVCGFSDGTLSILNSTTFELISGLPIQGHPDGINSISHSPDGTRFVTGCQDGSICQWDAKKYNATWDEVDYMLNSSDKWNSSDKDETDSVIYYDSEASEY